jgi:hypothetical protein
LLPLAGTFARSVQVPIESIVGIFLIAAFLGGLAYFGTRPEKKKQPNSK